MKNPTLRERLTETNSYDLYLKHRNEALRTRYSELASENDHNVRVGGEIDELLKNYMDAQYVGLIKRILKYDFSTVSSRSALPHRTSLLSSILEARSEQ